MSDRNSVKNLIRIVTDLWVYVDTWISQNGYHLAVIHRIDFHMYPGDITRDYHQVVFSFLAPGVTQAIMTVDLEHTKVVNVYQHIGY